MGKEFDKQNRLVAYRYAKMNNTLNYVGRSIREWAREKGFEEDVDQIKDCIEHCTQDGTLSDGEYRRLLDAVDTLFSLAQTGLITSEIGEMVEAIRKPKSDDHLKDVPGHRAENADTIIRLLHFDARQQAIEKERGEHHKTLDEVIAEKMRYNENRPRKHGKKA